MFAFFFLFATQVYSAGASEKITLQLAWKHQFQFAGYYAAYAKGYYEGAGLNVSIVEGGEGHFAREEVLNGRAQYGIAGVELLIHRTKGDPFVVLASIFQHSASILLTRGDSKISNPQDFFGKRVMILPGNKDADIIAMFKNEGVSLDSINRIDQSYNLRDLIEGRTDAVSAYLTNEPWHMKNEDIPFGIISPSTYGIDFYSDCLFTTEQEINNQPERVKEFLKASLRGWEYAMDNPEEIIGIIIKDYNVQKNREQLRYEAAMMQKLIFPKLVEVGYMNKGRWRHIGDTFVSLGELQPDYSIEGFLYDPNPVKDYTWIIRSLIISVFLIFFISGVLWIMISFNRRLSQEITARRNSEALLKKSEEKYRNIIRTTTDGFWLLDVEGCIQECNASYAKMSGYSIDELIGMSIPDLDAIENEKDISGQIRKIIEAGDDNFESMLRRKDDSVFNVEISTSFMSTENKFIAFIRDISKRKKIQEEREKLIRQLQSALAEVKTLRGIIPICASCKKIRDDKGYWNQIELYIKNHSEAEFSHGICPECAKKLYPDFVDKNGSFTLK